MQRFAVAVPAKACYLKAIRAFFKPILGDWFGEQTEMVILALDEACSNLVRHQTPEEGTEAIHASLEVEKDLVRFRIDNFCKYTDVPKIKPRELLDVRPGGLGMHYIQEIMDRVHFEPDPRNTDRMTLLLEKKLPCK